MGANVADVHGSLCVARLDSACGPLYLHETIALQILAVKLPRFVASESAFVRHEGFREEV